MHGYDIVTSLWEVCKLTPFCIESSCAIKGYFDILAAILIRMRQKCKHNDHTLGLTGKFRVCGEKKHFFSSPEPKAQGELIVWDSSRHRSVCASVCVCVRPCAHTFKHEYL